MSEPRRWTIHESPGGSLDGHPGSPEPNDRDGVEVMPVSEHEALREAAERVFKEWLMGHVTESAFDDLAGALGVEWVKPTQNSQKEGDSDG